MEGYRVLTPRFRAEINQGFDKAIAELQECEKNVLVNAQIEGIKMVKRYINGLPDGIPVPITK